MQNIWGIKVAGVYEWGQFDGDPKQIRICWIQVCFVCHLMMLDRIKGSCWALAEVYPLPSAILVLCVDQLTHCSPDFVHEMSENN